MKLNLLKLNNLQFYELAKVFLDIGKAIFLASVVTYFIPTVTDKEVPLPAFIIGLIGSLTFIVTGVILLSKGDRK